MCKLQTLHTRAKAGACGDEEFNCIPVLLPSFSRIYFQEAGAEFSLCLSAEHQTAGRTEACAQKHVPRAEIGIKSHMVGLSQGRHRWAMRWWQLPLELHEIMVGRPLQGEATGVEEQTSSFPGGRVCVKVLRSPRCFPEGKVFLHRPLRKELFH